MRIVVITSCTGEKAVSPDDQLTIDDFRAGSEQLAKREKALKKHMMRADELYTGQQHVRLMRSIKALRESPAGKGKRPKTAIDLYILSAGYGLVPANRMLAPYEVTFQGMKAKELRAWADQLSVPEDVRKLLASKYDLALLLLGDSYLTAADLNGSLQPGGMILAFCGTQGEKALKKTGGVRTVVLGNSEAKRFSCGLVGLKGELADRLLRQVSGGGIVPHQLSDPATDVLAGLDAEDQPPAAKTKRPKAMANPNVDRVITIPSEWWKKPHRKQVTYFIPEWDDLVDPDYDFETDTHSGGSGDWSNEVYAHQMYPSPNYDGILISKVVAEKSNKKKARINAMGVHRFLRVPREFPIMGDCGAFGYIGEKDPPYTTDEILDYYTRLDFDYGVSIDHLCVSSNEGEWKHRYELTIANAEEFIREHRKRRLDWVPIGAVQGWSPESYAKAAARIVGMGYKYIALGGLVRSSTVEIIEVLKQVRAVAEDDTRIHLFGLARLGGLVHFHKYGAASVDSTSFLRRAWMGTGQNYLTDRGEFVAAIRIPEAEKSFRAKRMVSEGRANGDQVRRMDVACRKAMRDFDAGKISVRKTCDILEEYDQLITPDRKSTRPLLEKTLSDKPWKRCECAICKKDGVQVIIFRGNNRNRRRGFHNTWLFYRMFQDVLAGKDVPVPGRKDLESLLEEAKQTTCKN